MRRFPSVWAVVFVLALPHVARSESLLRQLPEDGTWAKYYADTRIGENEITRTWVVASVGRTTTGGETFRFIELREHSVDEAETFQVIKLMVPESAAGGGKDLLASVRKVWVKRGRGDVREFSRLEEHDPGLALALAGPVKDVKKLADKQTIAWQRGSLECEAFAGSSVLELRGLKFEASHRVLVHEKTPFGVAGSRLDIKVGFGQRKQEVRAEFLFQDMGTGAKARIPDGP